MCKWVLAYDRGLGGLFCQCVEDNQLGSRREGRESDPTVPAISQLIGLWRDQRCVADAFGVLPLGMSSVLKRRQRADRQCSTQRDVLF